MEIAKEIKACTSYDLGNTASIQVAQNAGAEFECIAKARAMREGRAHSAAVYPFTK